MENKNERGEWNQHNADTFWGEISPCDHILQIYDTDAIFLDMLARFVTDGIKANEACIVIATKEHLRELDKRLETHNLDVNALIGNNSYIPLIAEEVLLMFMIDRWPDEYLFNHTITGILQRARGTGNRSIRAFGEMVAILWAQGNYAATVNLEQLWNKFCEKEIFRLFCAYPKSGFTNNMEYSIKHICNAHSKMIGGSEILLNEILCKEKE